MLTTLAASLAIWISATAGCELPTDTLPILPNNYNPIYVCSISPLPICGMGYKLSSPDDVAITYRLNTFASYPGFEYNQGFPIPSQMYATGLDWGWTILPGKQWLAPAVMVDKFVFTTPVNSYVKLEPNGVIVFDPVMWETYCHDLLEVPMDGRLPAPQTLRLRK